MADARLGILISADVAQANQGLASFNTALEKTDAELGKVTQGANKTSSAFVQLPRPINATTSATTKATGAFSQLQKQVSAFGGGVKTFSSNFAKIPAAVSLADNSLKKLPGSTNQATNALLNLGRVAQDAPFGFLGIANNLNPLLESFQRLRASTGSTGGALKSLGSSLVGAGGIGLALSVVSSALIVFGDEIFGASRKVSAAEIENERFSQSLTKMTENLKEIRAALDYGTDIQKLQLQLAGLTGSSLEIADANNKISANTTAIGRSAAALDPLRKEFDNLSNAAKNTISQFEKLKAEGERQPFIDKTNLRGDLVPTRNPAIAEANSIRGLNDAYKEFFETGIIGEKALSNLTNTQKIAAERLVELSKVVKSVQGDITKDAQENNKLRLQTQIEEQKAFADFVNEQISLAQALQAEFPTLFPPTYFSNLDSLQEKFKKASTSLKIFFNDLKNGFARTNTSVEITAAVPIEIEPPPVTEMRPVLEETAQKLSSLFKDFKVPVQLAFDPNVLQKGRILDVANGIKETIANGLSSSFNDFIEAIGRGANVFQSFGSLVKSVITSIIGQLLRAVALAAILAALGIGGVAGDSKNFLTSLAGIFGGRRAGGGPVANGRAYLVGENGPEMFFPTASGTIIPNGAAPAFAGIQSGGLQPGSLMGIIQGRDLALILARQGRYNRDTA